MGFSAAAGVAGDEAALSDPGGIAGATYGLGGCDGEATEAPGGGVGVADLDTVAGEGITGDDAGALMIAGAEGLTVTAGGGVAAAAADEEEEAEREEEAGAGEGVIGEERGDEMVLLRFDFSPDPSTPSSEEEEEEAEERGEVEAPGEERGEAAGLETV